MENILKKFIITLIFFTFTSLFAGRYAGDFMAIGAGVKSLALGGAFVALADDGSAVYWNASGIAQIRDTEVDIMRAFLYDGLAYYDNITFCLPLPNGVTIALNWTRLTINDIPIFKEEHIYGTNVDQRSTDLEWILNEAGIPDGKFTSTDDLFQLAFAKHIHQDFHMGWLFFDLPLDMYFGGNIKYIKRKIYENLGDGVGFDLSFKLKTSLGVLFDYSELGDIAIGLNLQDVAGTVITWNTESDHTDKILFNTKLGFAYEQPLKFIRSRLTLAMDIDYVYETVRHFGAEIQYKDIIAVRSGYYNENISAGMSVKIFDFTLDYTFLTNVLGNTNRIGLRINL